MTIMDLVKSRRKDDLNRREFVKMAGAACLPFTWTDFINGDNQLDSAGKPISDGSPVATLTGNGVTDMVITVSSTSGWYVLFYNSVAHIFASDTANLVPHAAVTVKIWSCLSSVSTSFSGNITNILAGGDGLIAADIHKLTKLTNADLNDNSIGALILTPLSSLQTTNLDGNGLTSLDLSGSPLLFSAILSNNSISSINLVGLIHLDTLSLFANLLTDLNLTQLRSLTTSLDVAENPLNTLEVRGLSQLQFFNFYHTNITTIDMGGMVNLNSFDGHGCHLTSVTMTGCNKVLIMDLSINSLPQPQIDAILAQLVSAGLLGGSCLLNGGTNAAPSAAGLANKAILTGPRGWTVTTN